MLQSQMNSMREMYEARIAELDESTKGGTLHP